VTATPGPRSAFQAVRVLCSRSGQIQRGENVMAKGMNALEMPPRANPPAAARGPLTRARAPKISFEPDHRAPPPSVVAP